MMTEDIDADADGYVVDESRISFMFLGYLAWVQRFASVCPQMMGHEGCREPLIQCGALLQGTHNDF
jgi:hypothetical protein